MNKNRKGILLNDSMDLAISVKKDSNGLITRGLLVDSCIDQEAFLVLQMKPGELKEDPVLGPGLTKFIRGKYKSYQVESQIKEHFERAGIDYDDYKDRLETAINGETV